MPDPAVPRNPDADASSAKSRQRAEADADGQKKLARAARPAQRAAEPGDGPRYGETLDLFAEDAERATLQALNTDIRQGTFEGFELPEVFLAAVESSARRRAARTDAAPREPADAPEQGDLITDALTIPSSTSGKAAIAQQASVAWIAAPGFPINGEVDPANALAHTVRAAIDEQSATAAAHACRTRSLLTVTLCTMLTTLAAGIAQTVALLHAGHQATLAFQPDTDPTSTH
ncbi:hypothetical protein [Caballeronia grimmiae]|uniref:hypothetical protein n=1 Tax=Caballeronia grimmiae TaxID=1071679 RepID=UPI0038BD031B